METIDIAVSGQSYWGACDPSASGVPTAEAWPTPRRVKAGRGVRFIYSGTRELSFLIESHLREVGESLACYSGDPDARAEGRAMLRDAERVLKERGRDEKAKDQ